MATNAVSLHRHYIYIADSRSADLYQVTLRTIFAACIKLGVSIATS